jgi:molybdate transport system substrate-binding protein
MRRLLAALVCGLVATGCGGREEGATVLVSVAASLKDVVDDVAADFRKVHPNVTINVNAGASGLLAQQIEQGAPVDVFVSASRVEIDRLQGKGLIVGAPRTLARNRLIVIVPASSPWVGKPPREVLVAPEVKRIALGDPESVPFGRYAREALRTVDLWDTVAAKAVYAADVRQALTYADQSAVDAAIVYATDALVAKNVKELGEVPGSHDLKIEAVGARLARSTVGAAQRFLDQLASPAGTAQFVRRGFAPPEP